MENFNEDDKYDGVNFWPAVMMIILFILTVAIIFSFYFVVYPKLIV